MLGTCWGRAAAAAVLCLGVGAAGAADTPSCGKRPARPSASKCKSAVCCPKASQPVPMPEPVPIAACPVPCGPVSAYSIMPPPDRPGGPAWYAPHPVAEYYSSAPPCLPCGSAVPPAPAAYHAGPGYELEVKLVEAVPGQKDKVSRCCLLRSPRNVAIDLDEPRSSCKECPACPAAVKTTQKPHGMMQCVFQQVAEDKVCLDISTWEHYAPRKDAEGGDVVRDTYLHSVRTATIGKPTRMVLQRDKDGSARRWAEITVRPVADEDDATRQVKKPTPCATGSSEACEPSSPGCCPKGCSKCCCGMQVKEHIASLWAAMSEMANLLTQMSAHAISQPAPCYVNHPPQYYPPMPVLPVPREVVVQQATPGVPTAHPASYVEERGAGPDTISTMALGMECMGVRAMEVNGHSQLEVMMGPACRLVSDKLTYTWFGKGPFTLTAEHKRVRVSGTDLEAMADVVAFTGPGVEAKAEGDTFNPANMLIHPSGQLGLCGHVHLIRHTNGQDADVKARRVILDLKSGSLDVLGANSLHK